MQLRLERVTAARRDMLAEWFSTLEACGECYTFRLGRYRDGMSEPEWFFLSHDRYDGLGGLAHVQRTVFHRQMELPRSKEALPGRWARLLAALRFVLRPSRRPLPWRNEDTLWRAQRSADSQPSAAAWALLSEAETLEIREQARSRDISLNAWLLWGLSQSALPRLVRKSGCLEWIMPVNMRGVVASERDTANTAWTLDVAFSADASPQQVQAAIRRELERRTHWGAWQLMHLFRHLRPEALRAVARRELQVRKHGCFSNLGMLGPPAGDADPDSWMAFNPVLKSRPVGAASLTWGGRLALTLQLHPALSHDPEEASAWLNDWTGRTLARGRYDAARCALAP